LIEHEVKKVPDKKPGDLESIIEVSDEYIESDMGRWMDRKLQREREEALRAKPAGSEITVE
jgi:hypothetical protein